MSFVSTAAGRGKPTQSEISEISGRRKPRTQISPNIQPSHLLIQALDHDSNSHCPPSPTPVTGHPLPASPWLRTTTTAACRLFPTYGIPVVPYLFVVTRSPVLLLSPGHPDLVFRPLSSCFQELFSNRIQSLFITFGDVHSSSTLRSMQRALGACRNCIRTW
jgi:hypothetical protein